jgi:hypothetical protein
VAELIHGFGAIDQHNDLLRGFLLWQCQQKAAHWWKLGVAPVGRSSSLFVAASKIVRACNSI